MSAVKNIPPEAIITAFESSYDGFHILDSDGNTLYMNEACTRIEGISKEDAETAFRVFHQIRMNLEKNKE